MDLGNMSVVVASDIYRDELFVEIRNESVIWAEVAYGPTSGQIVIRILPNRGCSNYVFDLTEMQDAVERAKRRLLELGPEPKDEANDGELK